MASRSRKRNEWHRTQTGGWSRTFGDRGMRVRLFQKRSDGVFYREVHVPGKGNRGRDLVSLQVWDRDAAERLGKELLSKLLLGQAANIPGPVRLETLWKKYSTECQDYIDNKKHSKEADISKSRNLIGYFGKNLDVRSLTPNDIKLYEVKRKAGGIVCEKGYVTDPVRQNAVHKDLGLLRRMLRWACTVRLPNGSRWLDYNPIDGLRFDREKNPVRPIASIERYTKTCEAINRLADAAETEAERLKWHRLELALYIAEATGRRRGSIVGLRWEDFDFTKNVIHWRAAYDKKGKDWIIPMSADFMAGIRRFQRKLGAVAGYLLPCLRDQLRPMPADMLTQWLQKAEDTAGLAKLPGGLWHPYRRKWASERMHLPTKAVADAGGWSDIATLQTCYQQTDEEMLLAVMSEPRKRSDQRVG